MKLPTFGFDGESVKFCCTHKVTKMKNLKITPCDLCKMTTRNRSYKPYCAQCHFYLHPEDSRLQNYKTKEQAFMVPLKKHYPNMVLDRIIDGGCSRRRPDGFIECLTHCVIVEIDEEQHIGYDDTCENRRMMELYSDAAFRPVVFVRLNPDGYRRDGKKINSTFIKTESRELKKRSEPEFNRRFEELKVCVDQAVKCIPTKSITVIQLCFTELF